MSHEFQSFTKTRRIHRTTFEEMKEWVNKSWNSVKIETIVSGFYETEIPNFSEYISLISDDEYGDIEEPKLFLDENVLHLFESDCNNSNFDGFE